jgi:NAD-reducing hydrogenase small subunit
MKTKVATAWLGGCSGCHMSFLDMDERLIELADKIELVYSPFADIKEFPNNVDITLVEGAITNSENEEMAHIIRKNSRLVIAFGDCATTGNVTAMRNPIPLQEIQKRSYIDLADKNPRIPDEFTCIAQLLKTAQPLHEIIKIDAWLHGCPPTADQIWFTISELLQGKIPELPPVYLRYG